MVAKEEDDIGEGVLSQRCILWFETQQQMSRVSVKGERRASSSCDGGISVLCYLCYKISK